MFPYPPDSYQDKLKRTDIGITGVSSTLPVLSVLSEAEVLKG
jgi:hypothetical protein